MTEWLGLPPLAAAHGGQIDNLIGWIHIFMLILFVAGEGSSSTPSFVSGSRGIRWRTTGGHVAQVDPISRSAWPWSKRFS